MALVSAFVVIAVIVAGLSAGAVAARGTGQVSGFGGSDAVEVRHGGDAAECNSGGPTQTAGAEAPSGRS